MEVKKSSNRGLKRKKFYFSEYLEKIREKPINFLDVCYYQGAKVSKYRQTKRILNLIAQNDKSIIVMPRGASKSFSLALIALWYFYTKKNYKVAIFSRSHRQSKVVLETCSDIIDSSPILKGARLNFQIDQRQRLKSHIGSEIIAHPYSASTVLGEHPDIILADECTFYTDDSFFQKIVLPMLSGVRTILHPPKIVMTSTFDEQRGFFYEIWTNAEKYEFQRLMMKWQECDGYTEEEMRKKKLEIGERAFASQYECEAQSTSSTFFSQKNIEQSIIPDYQATGDLCCGGIDLAKKRDYSSISICEVKENKFYVLVSSQMQLNYSELAEILKRYNKEYPVSSFLVDTTTGEEFTDFGMKEPYLLPLKAFTFTKQSREQILDYLRINFEQRRICIPAKFTELISDLRKYTIGDHLPDSISSLALCLWNEKMTHLNEKKIIKNIFAVRNF